LFNMSKVSLVSKASLEVAVGKREIVLTRTFISRLNSCESISSSSLAAEVGPSTSRTQQKQDQ